MGEYIIMDCLNLNLSIFSFTILFVSQLKLFVVGIAFTGNLASAFENSFVEFIVLC